MTEKSLSGFCFGRLHREVTEKRMLLNLLKLLNMKIKIFIKIAKKISESRKQRRNKNTRYKHKQFVC